MKASKETQVPSTFEAFCEKYSFYIPESHKNFYSPEDLHNFLVARYGFFKEHSTEVKIAVHNPDSEFLWLSNTTVIEVLLPDSPFIVDTIVDYCTARKYNIQLIIHPILNVVRSRSGALQSLNFVDVEDEAESESYVYLEVNRLPENDLRPLHKAIAAHLKELRGVVTDYRRMLPLLNAMTFKDESVLEEFEWLKENFVLLGLMSLEKKQPSGRHLGLFRKSVIRDDLSLELKSLPLPKAEESIRYRETEIHSNINKYRQIYVAVVSNGDTTHLLAGHFRHRADIALRDNIPAVKRMLDGMARQMRVPGSSYMRKELYKAAQSIPVGFLLTRSPEFLLVWFKKIISNLYAIDVNYDITIDQEYQVVWAEIILPMADAGKVPGQSLHRFLKAHDVQCLYNFSYRMNQIETVFLAFRSKTQTLPELGSLLEQNGGGLFSTWSSRFRELVFKKFSGSNLDEMLNRYLIGMSPDYEVHQLPEEALYDLDVLERLQDDDGHNVNYFSRRDGDKDFIKIYSSTPMKLSELVPILTDFSFTVNREYTFPYRPDPDGREKFTYAFSVTADDRLAVDDRNRIAMAIVAVLNQKMSSKPVNALVRDAGVTLRQLELVRALCGFYYKIETSYTFTSIQDCVIRNPAFSAALVQLFETRFDPEKKEADIKKACRVVDKSFAHLTSVVDEAICQDLLGIVNAIVRTNYFADKPEISFKIKSSLIVKMPRPVPYFEIYIYSHEFEGVHLRGGPVARGGLRWSDRKDDFRTEVLGLVKAQMVKNTVIVPVGSKGGFVLKNQTFANRDEMQKAGISAYRRFINCLLELTDNLAASGKVIPAPNIKRLDGDDTYLVVAADKGTATFSDIANEIAIDRKFWLSDAFASGGSNGYDHKKQGITAKGAWESVKRHFHEVGLDPEQDSVTAVGIGDMAGDVFGNGMVLSGSMKLLAAFNHLYIFLDPRPEPEASFQERQRLFECCGNWDQYNPRLISKGGGLFERASRKIEVSPEVREALGIKAKSLSGEELIKAILRAPVDLLWNGGIGTYVKSSQENHVQAGDPANDRVRIDATELRAKVLGEGGNLGLTQAGRIEAAARGARLNTDAIDNSAGVNMSDHEVNLKILLNILLRKKRISASERSKIIRKYEPDMITQVLDQNSKNNLGLSLDELRTPAHFVYQRALMRFLNRQGILSREQDCIPYGADLERLEQGSRRLTRPVLCAMVGFAKLYGTQILMQSDEFNDPWYDRFVLRYFPAGLSKKFERDIKAHPLRREIVITEVLNEIVNHAGVTFFQRAHMATQESPVALTKVYMRLAEFLNLSGLRVAVDLPGQWLPARLHYEYLLNLEEKVYRINKKILKDKTILKLLDEKDSAAFNSMLSQAAAHSNYRFPRKIRTLQRSLCADGSVRITVAFRQMDILEDAFQIFIHNKLNRNPWQVEHYFSTLQSYRVKELRQITKDLKASSTWEMLFFSKIESAVETLIGALIDARQSGKQKDGATQKVRSTIREILEMHSRRALTMATFFEMLNYMTSRLR